MSQEFTPLPGRRHRKAGRPAPRRRPPVLPVLLLLALVALAVALFLDPGLRAEAEALLTPRNLEYLGLGGAGLLALLILRRIVIVLARRGAGRPEPALLDEKPPRPPALDPLLADVPDEERAPGAGEQILFALTLFILSGLVIGAVLFLELQWYFDDSPYRYLGLAALGGLGLLVLVARSAGARRGKPVPRDAVPPPEAPRAPRRRRPAAREEVAAAREPARRRARAPRAEKNAGRVRVREAEVVRPEPAPAGPGPAPEPPAEEVKPPAPVLLFRPGRIGVGLDVGTSEIKMVQVRGTRKGPVVTGFGMALTPRQAIVEGVITKPQEVAEAIRALMTEIGLAHRRVVTVVGGQGVILRHAEFPRMSEQELRDVLRWEAEQYIPIPTGEAVSDFTILEGAPSAPREGKDRSKMKVLLVGTQQKIVQSLLDTLRAAALYPVAIDIDALAHFRVLTANGYCSPRPRNQSTMVVDIGASSTKLSVFQDGVPQLNRTILVAGNGITAAVAQGLEEDMSTAERTKREHGALPDTPIARYLQPVLDELLLEVRRSIEFYLVRNYGEDIKFIHLVGGGAALKGLPEALADYLNVSLTERAQGDPDITVVPVHPLREVELHPSLAEQRAYFGPQFAGALGLALREGG